ncbi:long-chain fatty acid--CoA ligase [Bacillus sp. FJAT-52991]|uniref:Long-chain fatty acid--CoA ligase n=1 Tax=Bacillus kandeliae TaxID=3129297 RepID=A0ABZ2N9M7_9BACI
MKWELDWLENRVRLTPWKTAVIHAGSNQQWNYQQINHRAKILVHFLLEQKVGKGDRVALISPNHISYFDLMFACAKIGAIFVPINWRLSIQEMNYILADCSPKLVGYHDQFKEMIDTLSFHQDRYFCVSSPEYEIGMSDENEPLLLSVSIEQEDPWMMIYTGGTTGKPKGVILSHRAILWNGLNTIVSWSLTANDTTLTYLPMFHTGGLNALTTPLLMIGGTVVIGNQFDPLEAIEALNQYHCTIALFVPTMYQMMIQEKAFVESSFPSMKVFLSGGAPCPLSVYEAFIKKGIAFKEGYGLTEAGPNNFYIDPEEAKTHRGSVGKSMLFNQIKLLKEDGTEAAVGEVGELLIQGKHTFSAYWNNQAATAEVLQNNWLHTGDLARVNKAGYCFIVGRKKEMIISGGENIYPLEVEQCLLQFPHIEEAAVIGLPDDMWGEKVVAFIVTTNQRSVPSADLQQHCQQALAKYKIPKQFIFIEELPKTHVGKIDKKMLVEIGKGSLEIK